MLIEISQPFYNLLLELSKEFKVVVVLDHHSSEDYKGALSIKEEEGNSIAFKHSLLLFEEATGLLQSRLLVCPVHALASDEHLHRLLCRVVVVLVVGIDLRKEPLS